MTKKQTKNEINLIDVSIKLDKLALDSHPTDIKQGRSVAKRIIKLDFIRDGGIVKIPAQKWMMGWLKLLFKSKAIGTVVLLPEDMEYCSLGTAKDILTGKTPEEWKNSGDKTVEYELGDELKGINLYPFHEYVPLPSKKGSIVKYYYKINDKSKPITLLIYTLIPPELVIGNMKSFGRIYGLGCKAGGYRIGTFKLLDSKINKVGEVIV